MASRTVPLLARSLLAAALATLLAAGMTLAAEVTLTATLTGDAEVPPVDTEATGSATIVIDTDAGTVCWEMTAENLEDGDEFTVSHIHEGTADMSGGVVVNLDLALSGTEFTSEGCTEDEPDAALLQAIVDDPSAYYVNVHSQEHGPGVIRGQLEAAAAAPPPDMPPDTAVAQPAAPVAPMLAALGLLFVTAGALMALRLRVRL